MQEQIIKAPYFSGFYGYELFSELGDLTSFADNNSELYCELCDKNLERDFYEKICDIVDWQKTKENISKQLVDNIYFNTFSEWVEMIDFDNLWSPKYYNYRTDEIYMKIAFTDEQLEEIELFCFGEKKKSFEKHLKDNYTSVSGFISFIPNNLQEFKSEYREYKHEKDEKYETYLGILFEFIFNQQNHSDDCVSPYDSESIWEALAWLRDFDEEEIAKQLIEEYEHEPKI
ncbi:hypothetical protein [Bacteroides sp. 224]|uniref:hypothetical protein n=1 Tax=Bacteroides sp. 224 TaxID=2302936 RepID=UPI0013CF9F00|nr:hypothetical protein [Bacteroides sp. 224]NDV63993.1 hypothetical protein [Bacteroides sp. 224]